ncbi:MAG: S41 family peptidase [Planctomycetales bacterium]|nr:S41 family peptidase [Planctomycetales bacterium]
MSRRSLLLIIVSAFTAYACYVRAEQNPYSRYVAAGFSIIDRWSLQDVPDQELFNGAMTGMVDVLRRHGDEHSQFVAAAQREAFREDLSQEFGGVGIRLRSLGDPPQLTVVGPPEFGTPAYRADVQSGDRLTAVDGASIAGLTLDEATELIRGPIGTDVRLSLTRYDGAEPHDVVLQRAVIVVDSILGDARDGEGRWVYRLQDRPDIGYFRITKFGDKTTAELTTALADLLADDAPPTKLIIDLRDNAGGVLDAATEISDLFLPAGLPIVTTRDRNKKIREQYLSTGSGKYLDIPLVMLVNHNSASASEILAACLQDYHRALVVGERTYGKGTVQPLIGLESGRSLLKLTSATYWRPSGRNIHRMPGDPENVQWGVSPDEQWRVELDERQYLYWRRYRLRRDLLRSPPHPELLHQLDLQDGALPEGFGDVMLDKAIEAIDAAA